MADKKKQFRLILKDTEGRGVSVDVLSPDNELLSSVNDSCLELVDLYKDLLHQEEVLKQEEIDKNNGS